jgi:1-Cys peroxiredoxin 6
MPNLGDVMPNFKADTTGGEISFHDFIGDSWTVLFSHPADFTPVCTTELGMAHTLAPEFKKRGVKLIALSCDGVDSHNGWIKDIQKYNCDQGAFSFPIIADPNRDIAVQLGMLDPDEKDAAGLPLTARAVFVVGPDKKLKLSILYPATTGRNFDELLRVIDSLQLTATKKVATPVNWKMGDEAMVVPSVKPEDVASIFPNGVRQVDMPSSKHYMRFTTDYQ